MPLLTSPNDRDVVVRQETRDGTVIFVLRTAHGTDQFLLRTREEAVAQAVRFANGQGVRAWLSGQSGDWLPLGTGTETTSVQSSSRFPKTYRPQDACGISPRPRKTAQPDP